MREYDQILINIIKLLKCFIMWKICTLHQHIYEKWTIKNNNRINKYYCSCVSASKLLLFISWSKNAIQYARWLTLTVTAYLMSSQFTQQETWLCSAHLRQSRSFSLCCVFFCLELQRKLVYWTSPLKRRTTPVQNSAALWKLCDLNLFPALSLSL